MGIIFVFIEVELRFIEEIFCGIRGRMCVNHLYKQRFS